MATVETTEELRMRTGGKDNGGFAFPGYAGPLPGYAAGMSLRDYFAAQALPTVLMIAHNHADEKRKVMDADYLAQQVYEIADAMLEARKR